MSETKDSPNKDIKWGYDYDNPECVSTYMDRYSVQMFGQFTGYKFFMKHLHDIFNTVTPPGDRHLDFGCGPAIWGCFASSRHCKSITCADISTPLRNQIQKWTNQDSDAHDWTHFLKFQADLEGCDFKEVENRVRSSIKDVIHCDLGEENVLAPAPFSKYDVVTSALAVGSWARTDEEYAQGIAKLAGHLNPGGILIISGFNLDVGEDPVYPIGNFQFHSQDAKRAVIEKGFADGNVKDMKWIIEDAYDKSETINLGFKRAYHNFHIAYGIKA